MDIFTRLIWTATAQHTAVNYPITAYGAFTPNMPTKLYDDDRVAPEVFNAYRLPNGFLAAVSWWCLYYMYKESYFFTLAVELKTMCTALNVVMLLLTQTHNIF